MSGLDEWAGSALEWLGQTSWQVAILVVLVAVVQRLCGRWLSPPARHALWLLVVLRLVMPSLPESPSSLFNLARTEPAFRLADRDVGAEAPVGGGVSVLPRAPESARKKGALPAPRGAPKRRAMSSATALLVETDAEVSSPASVPLSDTPSWRTWALIAWLAVACAICVRALIAELRFHRRLRRSVQAAPSELIAALAASAKEMRIRRVPDLLLTESVVAPALAGVIRPRLLLPPRAAHELTRAELACVFRHELAHLAGRDPLLNRVLLLLQCLHWFNPAVWFAFARLRAERELACDWRALNGSPSAGRRLYGHTLLKLITFCAPARRQASLVTILDPKRDLKRRMSMIASYDGHHHRGRFLALGLSLVLGAVALTSAASSSSLRGTGSTPQEAGGFREIRVQGESERPSWEMDLRRKLATSRASFDLERSPLGDALGMIRDAAGINLVVDPEALDQNIDEVVNLKAQDWPADRVLEALCRQVGLAWGPVRGVVFVAEPYRIPTRFSRRVYDIRPLISQRDSKDSSPEDQAARLKDVIRDVVGPGEAWEREGASMRYWQGLLVVTQSEVMHGALQEFMNRLLNRGRGPKRPTPDWRREMENALSRRISVDFEDASLQAVLDAVRKLGGINLILDEDIDPSSPVSLSAEELPLTHVLEWIALLSEVQVTARDGVIHLGPRPEVVLRYYEVTDLLTVDEGGPDEEARDHLVDLLRDSVDPASWDDFEEVQHAWWQGLLIVRHTPAVHREVAAFIATLRRALKP